MRDHGEPITVQQLVDRTGWTAMDVRYAVGSLMRKNHVARADEPRTWPALFQLQQRGESMAMQVNMKDVVFSKEAEALLAQRGDPIELAPTFNSEQIARSAVGLLGQTDILSSIQLATRLACTPEQLDASLDPLVQTSRLQRVSVLRSDVLMFDYRVSSSWGKPTGLDFEICCGATKVPQVSISPVARPATAKLVTQPQVALPLRSPAQLDIPRFVEPADQVDGTDDTKAPGAAVTPPAADIPIVDIPADRWYQDRRKDEPLSTVERVAATTEERAALSLGWQVSGDLPTNDELAHKAVLAEAIEPMAAQRLHEATDAVCAINSRGELAIDIGDGEIVTFPPKRALALRQFLVGCAFLETIHTGVSP
jgi:hypothetical protein